MATATENRIHKPSSHRALSRKALIGVLLVVGVAAILVAVPTVVVAASPPWWVTATGGIIGGAIGATGGPIGAIVGATTGAIVADYIYSLTSPQSKAPSTLNAAQTQAYTGSVMNATLNAMLQNNATALTEHDLTQTSYYYFAQLENAMVPQFLPNQTLNETYLGWDSGMYSALNNISASAVYPLNSISFNIFDWLAANSYPQSTATTYAAITPFMYGNNMSVGSYFWLTPASDFYTAGNSSMMLQNVATGSDFNVTIKTQTVTGGSLVYTAGGADNGYSVGKIIEPSISKGSQFGITAGVYRVMSESTTRTGIVNNAYTPSYTYNFQGIMTDSMELSSNGAVSNSFSVGSYTTSSSGVSSPDTISGIMVAQNYGGFGEFWLVDGLSNTYVTTGPTSANNLNTIQSVLTLLSGLSNSASSAYQSALALFNELHSLGYYTASSVPASLLQITPSTVVPTSMLNGTFNATELQTLLYAYLLQLKSWFNSTASHNLKSNMTVNNSTFDNGFVQVYGNLEQNVTSAGATTHNYYNNTWFVPLINLGHWPFKDKTWTNITNNSPDPNFLIVSGTDSGTLVNVYNGTFYTEAISVNGTSVLSYTISPVTIQYVLPHTVQIGKLSNGGFFVQKEGPLATWEWILIGLISLVAVAAIFERRD